MGNIYSAQNIASYLIYELNDSYSFVNANALQYLLAEVDYKWQVTFGHSAYSEQVHTLKDGYTVKEVYDAYAEHGLEHIATPAKEYFLPYGQFQLIERPYAVPNLTLQEQNIITSVIYVYQQNQLRKAS